MEGFVRRDVMERGSRELPTRTVGVCLSAHRGEKQCGLPAKADPDCLSALHGFRWLPTKADRALLSVVAWRSSPWVKMQAGTRRVGQHVAAQKMYRRVV